MSTRPRKVVMVDNRDSFTYNIVQLLAQQGADVTVMRSDRCTARDVVAAAPDLVVISPGPGAPPSAGCSLDVIDALAGATPIFGVCLGLQCIGEAFGGTIARAPAPMHGKLSAIDHDGAGCLAGVPSPFDAIRYHSLVIEPESFPAELEITATTNDGDIIMAARHRTLPIEGVQFHPESVLSTHGDEIIANALRMMRTQEPA